MDELNRIWKEMEDELNRTLKSIAKGLNKTMIELPEFVVEDDLQWLVEEVDPDWKDHFLTIDSAMEFYQDSKPMDAALKELQANKLNEAQRQEWLAQDADDTYFINNEGNNNG